MSDDAPEGRRFPNRSVLGAPVFVPAFASGLPVWIWKSPAVEGAAYTYLDVRNDTADTRVAYKPCHTADADLQWAIDSKWTVGTGLHLVADRLRSATLEMEDYTTARVYASYAVNDQLRIKARVENVLDEKYEESFGYPALPIGVFGAVEWRF